MSKTRKERKSKDELFIHELEESQFLVNHLRIDVIKDYLNQFDEYLKNKTKEINKNITEWQNSEKEKEYSAIDYYLGDYINYNSNFRKLKIESTFLSSYSLFEHFFKTFTEIYKNHYDLQLSIDDLNGNNYISKSKRYLEKVVNLNLESLNSDWKEITNFQKIRNKIVHNNGRFNPKEKETINELSKMGGIEINVLGLINLTDKEFILNFWKVFDKYISGIIKLTAEETKTTPNTV